MEAIFTTRELVGGLVIGIVAGLIVIRVDRWLAAGWSWYRTRSAVHREKRERFIVALVANPTLLAVAYLDNLVGMVMVGAAFGVFTQIATTLKAVPPSPGISSEQAKPLLLALATLLVIVGFLVGRRLSTAQEAWRRSRLANGLPIWW